MLEAQKQAFREEAAELLSELESSLLELEDAPGDLEVVGRVFRAMHTIKGSGAMFGFEAVSAFTHGVENVYDLVRAGKIEVTPKLIDASLQARDHIQLMLSGAGGQDDPDPQKTAELSEIFRSFLPSESEEAEAQAADEIPGEGDFGLFDDAPAAPSEESPPQDAVLYRIRFLPKSDLFRGGTNPLPLLAELRELGPCHIQALTDPIPDLNDFDPEACHVGWEILLTTAAGENAIRDVFIFVEDEAEITIETLQSELSPEDEAPVKKLGEILLERGEITEEDLQGILSKQKRIGDLLVEEHLVSAEQVEAAVAEQKRQKEAAQQRQKQKQETEGASVRVPAERLDRLVDLVGELVTVQSRLSQTAGSRHDADLVSIAEEVERLTEELRDSTLNLRMLPIGTIFGKFKRLVRDLCRDLGKEIELVTEGGDTELDKTVIERLGDPLVHILRNSMDHGIESPRERERAGKPRQGTVKLSAEHSGDSVLITIADDGGGLSTERIREKAIEKGIIHESDELSEAEIHQLIFAPGFSTAAAVSSVSGRGVGMDVVKKAIESLRGSIDLESASGKGTTLRIRLPLTLAIIDSLLTRIGGETYVLPLSLVEECVELTAAERKARHGRHLVAVRGQLVPYIDLRESFAIEGNRPAIAQVVITGLGGQRIGLVVDRVIGEHQTVIKSLGRMYRDVAGLSGATILGDGSVALILDVPQLIQMSEIEEREAVA